MVPAPESALLPVRKENTGATPLVKVSPKHTHIYMCMWAPIPLLMCVNTQRLEP